MHYKALIFDMDGVLVDSESLHAEAEKQTCNEYQIAIPPATWESFKGKTAHDIFSFIVETYGDKTQHNVAELISYKTNLYLTLAGQKLRLLPGALECLYKARVDFQKLALTTSSKQAIQEMVFTRFNLYPYFDAIVTGDEIQNGKPHPEPYLKTAEKLGIHPSESIVIEDSDNGVLAAKNAGALTIGLATSFPRETLLKIGADYTADTFDELQDLLETFRKT